MSRYYVFDFKYDDGEGAYESFDSVSEVKDELESIADRMTTEEFEAAIDDTDIVVIKGTQLGIKVSKKIKITLD